MSAGEFVKKHRTALGVIASVAWLCFMTGMLIRNEIPLKLNEWGDTFAGFFAPIAFLWLVLGYFQQGEELRLQAEELRRSVEHQGELAQIAKQQLSNETQQMRDLERQKRKNAMPDIRVSFDGSTGGKSGTTYTVKLQNKGGGIRVVSLEGEHFQILSPIQHRIDEGESCSLVFEPKEYANHFESPPTLVLHYVDRLGNQGFAEWEPTFDLYGRVENGSFMQIDSDRLAKS